MELKTVKVITNSGIPQYLYHGGALRSHILYTDDIEHLNRVNFKQMNFSEIHLREVENERLKRRDKGLSIEIVTIILDENYKFIKEKDSTPKSQS